MSIEIDILNGDASWRIAQPLHQAVWGPRHAADKPSGLTSNGPMPIFVC